MSLFEQRYSRCSQDQGREGAEAEAQTWEPALRSMEGQEKTTAADTVSGEGIRCKSPRCCWGSEIGKVQE